MFLRTNEMFLRTIEVSPEVSPLSPSWAALASEGRGSRRWSPFMAGTSRSLACRVR